MPSWFTPLPRSVTRPLSFAVLFGWAVVMAVLVNRTYLQASANLATDLARYGSGAQWRGVYYRGEKLGFTVSQTIPTNDDESGDAGFELQEDAELQMSLLGATTPAKIRTTARVNRAFELQAFEFSLDPGTGPIAVTGKVAHSTVNASQRHRLTIAITTAGATRIEQRDLLEPPMLSLNLARRLADAGLASGKHYEWTVFDPATLRNAPITIDVAQREIIRAGSTSIPAFRVSMEFVGLRTTSWVTDTGEVVREESPMGIITVREPAERAIALAVPGQMRRDLLQASAVVPVIARRTPPLPPLDDPRDVRHLKIRLEGAELSSLDLQGVGQTVNGDVIDIRDAQQITAGAKEGGLEVYLAAEPFIESDAPEIREEAEIAVRGVTGARARAEALTRYVNAILQKKPTLSLPSAREVLRTKIGDCNEHTALLVAMARSIRIPARIAVGLAFAHGAFYYHAWPEVYIEEGERQGLWLPVDPTFNQFPADTTHIRLVRGGLDKQAAIIPLLGRIRITVLALELAPDARPMLVGPSAVALAPAYAPPPRPSSRWCLPCFLTFSHVSNPAGSHEIEAK
jgi:transglutaminase-like putative cysteine protease